MYTDEIDLVNIINTVRQLKVAFKILLSKNQLKIIQLANYRSLSCKINSKESIVQSVIEASKKDRLDKLCNELDLGNGRLEELSTKELITLNKVLGIELENESNNASNISRTRQSDKRIFPIVES